MRRLYKAYLIPRNTRNHSLQISVRQMREIQMGSSHITSATALENRTEKSDET